MNCARVLRMNEGSAKGHVDGTRTLRAAAQAVDSGVGELAMASCKSTSPRAPWTTHAHKAADLLRLRNGTASPLAPVCRNSTTAWLACTTVHSAWCRVRTFRDEADDNWLIPSRVNVQGLA